MLFVATGLILLGGITALLGQKLFRLILPIVGFVVGVMVGYGGVQGVFGTGVISFSIAILMAVVVGAIMAILSFAFFDLAINILVIMLGFTAFTYLGVALGLQDNGFILFLMGLAGGILGLIVAVNSFMSLDFVFAATAFLGIAMILAGVMLFAGDITLDQLNDQGVLRSVIETVDQSFLWLFVWIAGSVVALRAQVSIAVNEFLPDTYEYEPTKK